MPREPAPFPVSFDPSPVRARFEARRNRRPLYSLRGGSVTMGGAFGAYGVGAGEAEVLALGYDKLRLYDFSP